MNNNYDYRDSYQTEQEYYQTGANVQEVFIKTYLIMLVVLLLSAASAFITATSESVFLFVFSGSNYLILFFAEIAIVFAASSAMKHKKTALSGVLLIAYSIINGMTLASIFLIYELGSIGSIFVVSAVTFAIMAVYGMITKSDLTAIGNIGMMALIGVLVATLLNLLIFKSSGFDVVLSIIGVAVFVGLTAYDTQKIKRMAAASGRNSENTIAMYGALTLYLDFVNMFLRLLSLFGKRR